MMLLTVITMMVASLPSAAYLIEDQEARVLFGTGFQGGSSVKLSHNVLRKIAHADVKYVSFYQIETDACKEGWRCPSDLQSVSQAVSQARIPSDSTKTIPPGLPLTKRHHYSARSQIQQTKDSTLRNGLEDVRTSDSFLGSSQRTTTSVPSRSSVSELRSISCLTVTAKTACVE